VLLRLSYLAVSSAFTVMGLLPVSGTAKDIEILAMRHQHNTPSARTTRLG
jgi:putative transposase